MRGLLLCLHLCFLFNSQATSISICRWNRRNSHTLSPSLSPPFLFKSQTNPNQFNSYLWVGGRVILCFNLHLHFCSNYKHTHFLLQGSGGHTPYLSPSPLLFKSQNDSILIDGGSCSVSFSMGSLCLNPITSLNNNTLTSPFGTLSYSISFFVQTQKLMNCYS